MREMQEEIGRKGQFQKKGQGQDLGQAERMGSCHGSKMLCPEPRKCKPTERGRAVVSLRDRG